MYQKIELPTKGKRKKIIHTFQGTDIQRVRVSKNDDPWRTELLEVRLVDGTYLRFEVLPSIAKTYLNYLMDMAREDCKITLSDPLN